MRVETIRFAGEAATWDEADQARFRALAGNQFLRVEDGNAIVSNADGRETTIYPGWYVTLPDGGAEGQAVFASPDRVRIIPG